MRQSNQRSAKTNGKSNEAATHRFVFSGSIPYAEKSEYVEKNLIFAIISIEFEAGRGFEGEDRWAATVEPTDDRGQEIITFTCNDKRDEQLKTAQAYIKQHGSIQGVSLIKSGKAYVFRNASAAAT